MTIATVEPATLTAGDSWEWTRSLADYPAGAGWSLVYAFRNSEFHFNLTSSASGDDHAITEAATATEAREPGVYVWVAFAKLGAARHRVASGRVTVEPNFEAARPFEMRSQVKRTLDAVNAVLEGKAGQDVLNYTIGNRALAKHSHGELLALRSQFQAEYARELASERLQQGLGGGPQLSVRFLQ